MTNEDSPRWGTIEQAAKHLGVNPRTISRMISDGELPGYRLGPRLVRVDLNDIDALLKPMPVKGES